ncbi:MAG TPA: hypothetical protein VK901_21965 [Nitrospiraceae bacterium]|nr:hypothetical protein [Nitrospiraceae bacterium]
MSKSLSSFRLRESVIDHGLVDTHLQEMGKKGLLVPGPIAVVEMALVGFTSVVKREDSAWSIFVGRGGCKPLRD